MRKLADALLNAIEPHHQLVVMLKSPAIVPASCDFRRSHLEQP